MLQCITQHSPAARFTVCSEQPIRPVEASHRFVNSRKTRQVQCMLARPEPSSQILKNALNEFAGLCMMLGLVAGFTFPRSRYQQTA